MFLINKNLIKNNYNNTHNNNNFMIVSIRQYKI